MAPAVDCELRIPEADGFRLMSGLVLAFGPAPARLAVFELSLVAMGVELEAELEHASGLRLKDARVGESEWAAALPTVSESQAVLVLNLKAWAVASRAHRSAPQSSVASPLATQPWPRCHF